MKTLKRNINENQEKMILGHFLIVRILINKIFLGYDESLKIKVNDTNWK